MRKERRKKYKNLDFTKEDLDQAVRNGGYNPVVYTNGPLNEVNVDLVAALNQEDVDYLFNIAEELKTNNK
tara:strand:- start:15916 stop:16125 length:210 start_codon:yes stop_codon:yes gene_type:complete